MSKIIETGSDSRTKLLSGVNQLANAVVTTLGPKVVITASANCVAPSNNFTRDLRPVLIILLIVFIFNNS